MSRYKAYSKYKDSGVEWLGKIPENWDVVSIKRRASIFNGATPKSDAADFWDGDISWVTPADLGKDKSPYIAAGARSITAEGYRSCGTTLVPSGSVILSSRAPIGTLGIAAQDICTNQGCKSLVTNINLESKYLFYVLHSSTAQLNLLGRGTTFLELSADELGSYKIGCPPLSNQHAIAAFLDHETAKIDALIEKQRRLIELLKEKRQAVISHAVTKGLNPNAPMKNSGVEWLGEVPAHWEVMRLKHLAENIKAGPFGSAITKDMYVSAGYRVYGQEQVIPEDFSLGDYYISPETFLELSQYEVASGDILISCVGTFGKIAVVPPWIEPGIINPRLIRFRCNGHVTPSLLAIILRSPVVFEQFAYLSRGGTMDVINIGTLSEINVVVPPQDEQAELVERVNCDSARFDALTREAETATALLKERRTALISAAVTGKIDVRDWQPAAAQDEAGMACCANLS